MRKHHEDVSMLIPIVMGSATAVGVFARAWIASKQPQPEPEDTGEAEPAK